MGPAAKAAAPTADRSFDASACLASGLQQHHFSLAISTTRAKRPLCLGLSNHGPIKLHERRSDQPKGLMATGESPWMAARNQPWKPNNHLAPYTALPIASLKSGSYALARPKGEWLAVSAMTSGAMLGSAIAERQAGGAASQRCLWVDPAWRRQGMDTGLLNGPMRCADQEGIGALSPPYQAQELSQLGAPESLLPPADPRRIAPKGSLALLDQGDGAGWIRAERLSANIHHCRRLFVATQPQGRERGHALLATTFQRQQQTKTPISRAAVAANNHALQRLLKRQLKTGGTSLHSPRKASCRPRGAAG